MDWEFEKTHINRTLLTIARIDPGNMEKWKFKQKY